MVELRPYSPPDKQRYSDRDVIEAVRWLEIYHQRDQEAQRRREERDAAEQVLIEHSPKSPIALLIRTRRAVKKIFATTSNINTDTGVGTEPME